MQSYGRVSRIVMGIVSTVCLIGTPLQTAAAYQGSYYVVHPARPRVAFILPYGSVRLRFGDGAYYYYRGRYYHRRHPFGYVVVPAPVGMVVPTLPARHRIIVIHGIPYHECEGVFYKSGPSGYTVIRVAP